MVFAVWAIRRDAVLGAAEQAFHQAKHYGLERAGEIAQREAAGLGLDPGYCRRYLSTIIRYDLGPLELAGLQKYHQLAAELGLAPQGATHEHHRPDLVESR
jgi:chorismate dehydratase